MSPLLSLSGIRCRRAMELRQTRTIDGPMSWQRDLSKANIGVVNRGIGGNRVLADGLGPNALARFDRDVLATPGARYLIVLEGVNDIGGLDRSESHPVETHNALVREIEAAYVQGNYHLRRHGDALPRLRLLSPV